MTHVAVPTKDLTKIKQSLIAALAQLDGLLPPTEVAGDSSPTPAKRGRKPKTRDEKIVNPEGGFQP